MHLLGTIYSCGLIHAWCPSEYFGKQDGSLMSVWSSTARTQAILCEWERLIAGSRPWMEFLGSKKNILLRRKVLTGRWDHILSFTDSGHRAKMGQWNDITCHLFGLWCHSAQSAHMSTPPLFCWTCSRFVPGCSWTAAADSSSIYCNLSASLHLL